MAVNPYDDLPYKCLPVEWTAPERLALASLLHGGPRLPPENYRVLELGCGDGANLLPMASYRQHGTFVGVDGASSQIDIANTVRLKLGLSNVEFIHADFIDGDDLLQGQFDFIIGHGVFSWVSDVTRNALLRLCAKRLREGGLLYLNYNANPGWRVRGMVRDFLLAQTVAAASLRLRAGAAQDVSGRILASLPSDHPYSKLMANEFRFVCENDVSYIAHEYLATDNHAYWRREFMELVSLHGFHFVADADFNYDSGRVPGNVAVQLGRDQIVGHGIADTVDLLCYRQLHSPILTTKPFAQRPLGPEEFGDLFVASSLEPVESTATGSPMFQHSTGYQVEVKEDAVRDAFEKLRTLWPSGIYVREAFLDVRGVMEDLLLLHRNGLIDLRCAEPTKAALRVEPLKRWENERAGYSTTPYHTTIAAVA